MPNQIAINTEREKEHFSCRLKIIPKFSLSTKPSKSMKMKTKIKRKGYYDIVKRGSGNSENVSRMFCTKRRVSV